MTLTQQVRQAMRRAGGVALLLGALSGMTQAATVTVPVLPADDVVTGRYWGYFGQGTWTDAGANPNTVSHRYMPGDGESMRTRLTFQLGGVSLLPADIESVQLFLDVLTIWSEGSNEVGQISGVGPVLASQGTGWKGYDATTPVLAALTRGDSSVSFTVDYVGYTGFQFSSAEGGKPAYLQFTTAAPVPEAESVALALAGLGVVGLVHLRRRRAG